jgi:hypothetical protein
VRWYYDWYRLDVVFSHTLCRKNIMTAFFCLGFISSSSVFTSPTLHFSGFYFGILLDFGIQGSLFFGYGNV